MSLVWEDGLSPSISSVNFEKTATLTFNNADVRAVYVDWDDGDSNKKDESNYQWIELTEPKSSITVKHTYNKAGDFNPIVQTINSAGFISRYYGAPATNTEIVPYSQDTGIVVARVNDIAPSAVMKVENTQNSSGIDNSIMQIKGPKKLYIAVAPTLTRAELTGTIQQVSLSIEGVTHINKYIQTAADMNEEQFNLGSMSKLQTFNFDLDFTQAANQYGLYDFYGEINSDEIALFSEVLKFKYVSCKATGTTAAAVGNDYTTNEILNRLKIFIVVKDDLLTGGTGTGTYYPIAYVTAGSPIKSVEDNQRYSTLDMGQSRTAASNKIISNYRYDNGKMWFSSVNQWDLEVEGSYKMLGTGTKQTLSTKAEYYSYLVNPLGLNAIYHNQVFTTTSDAYWYAAGGSDAARQDSVPIDDYGRFYDQYLSLRTSVEASSLSGSLINLNQPEVFRVYPCPDWSTAETITATPNTDYSAAMLNNGSSNVFKLSSVNTAGVQKDILGNVSTTQAAEYIILPFDSKTNKVFFNGTNFANGLMSALSGFDSSSGLKIAGVEYLHMVDAGTKHQNAFWKSVDFVDTTKIEREVRNTTSKAYDTFHNSFTKSGYIGFDMPADWDNISIKKLCGGQYNTASGSFSSCIAAGQDDVTITGSASTHAMGTVYGYGNGYIRIELNAVDDKTAMQTIGDEDEVGAYKYAFIVTAGTASGSMWWVASGNSSGWAPAGGTHGRVILQVGETGTSASNSSLVLPNGTITGSVRRINIYDVIDGASKVFQDGGAGSGIANTGAARLMPTQSQYYKAGGDYWFNNNYNVAGSFTDSSWATNDKYVLKVTLSGVTNSGLTSVLPCPEIWNVFDATTSDTVVIKSIDDSAYNLNSLPITSDVAMRRSGVYYRAITRKGKTFIAKTGVGLEQIGFSSKALGDVNSSTAFADHGPSTMYGYLHMVRKLQEDAVPVYWDEVQKDGTYIRLWGVIANLNETVSVEGPRSVLSYTCNMLVKDIALIDTTGKLMTDRFALGGVPSEKDYS